MSITVRVPRFSDDAEEFSVTMRWPNSDHVEVFTYPVPRSEDGTVDRQRVDEIAWAEYQRVNDIKHEIWPEALEEEPILTDPAEIQARALAALPHPEESRPEYPEDPGTTAPPDFQG
jgi:hypothetical protein